MGDQKIAKSYMGGSIFGPRFTWVLNFLFLSGTYAPILPLSNPGQNIVSSGGVKITFNYWHKCGSFRGVISANNLL